LVQKVINIQYLIGQNKVRQTRVTKLFEGDENFIRRKIMSQENFDQESLHLQAVLLDKSGQILLR